MANDPAFLFYPGDYLRDTQCLSERSQVAYDRIMCEHMRNICITQAQLDFFTKRLTVDEKSELMMVLTPTPAGFCIQWVVESIVKRREYSDSRRKNRSSKEKVSKKDMSNISKSYVVHMENENEIEDVIEIKLKEGIHEIYIDQQKPKWPHLDLDFQYRTFCEKVRGSPDHYRLHTPDGLRLAFQNQLRNAKHNNKPKESPGDLAAAFAARVRKDTNGK